MDCNLEHVFLCCINVEDDATLPSSIVQHQLCHYVNHAGRFPGLTLHPCPYYPLTPKAQVTGCRAFLYCRYTVEAFGNLEPTERFLQHRQIE